MTWIERFFLKQVINAVIKKIENMNGSFKTTMYAIVTALTLIGTQLLPLLDTDPVTIFNLEAFIASIVTALALFKMGQSARDKDVSTESEAASGTVVKK